MKVLKIAAIVVVAAVAISTGIGMAAGFSMAASFASTMGSIGALVGSSTLASALVLGAAAVTAGSLMDALFPKPSGGGSQTKWKADPYAGLPYVMGRTMTAGNVVGKFLKGANNMFMGVATVLSIGPIHAYEASFMNKTTMSWSRDPLNATGEAQATNGFKGYIFEQRTLGLCPESYVPGGASDYPAWSNPGNRLSGLATVFNSFCYNSKASDTLTSLPTPGWIVEGVLVYDPRLDSTYPGGSGPCRALDETTYVYSENPHLHALTWVLGRWQNGVRVAGIGAPLSRIDMAPFVEGANLCDARGWKLGGQVYTRPDTPWNSLKAMLQAGGATPAFPGGIITCINRAPRVSLATITHRDIVGKCSFSGTQSRRTRINGIIPQYRSEAHDWEMVSAQIVQVADYVALDGDERTREISYPLVQSAAQVGQLAAYDICDAREAGPGTITLPPAWLNYRIGDCVTFQPEDGWTVKVIITGRALDASTGAVTYTVRSETDAKHAYALGTSGVAPPTAGLTYDDTIAAPAADWMITGAALTTEAGASIPALVASGAVSNGNADAVVFDYRLYAASLADEGGWLGASYEAPTTTRKEITGVTPDTAYQVSVRYRVRGALGPRAIFGPVTSGAGFTGDLNATNGAPSGTPVGSTTADAVSGAVLVTVPSLASSITAAQAQLTSLNGQIAGAATAAASAHDDAATALAQISAEVARAQGAEGALTTSVANLQTSVGSLSSTVSANYTALSSTDASLAASITSLTANYNGLSASYSAQSAAISTLQAQSASYEQRLSAGSPNLCPNGSGELGKTNWTDRAGTWTVNGPDGWGTWFRCLSGFTSGYAYFDSDPIVVFQGNAYTCALDADSEVSSGSDREAWVELLWFASLADANNLANEITPRTVGPHLSQPWFGNAAANRQALKVTATPPAGANYVRVRPVARGTNLSLAGFRQIKFEQGTLATPYSQEATSHQQYVVQQTDKASLASSISTLTAGVNANTAAISSEATTRASDVATLTSSINTMSSQFVLGGNQLSNTDFPGGNAAGWNWGSTTGAMIYSTGINSPSDDWHPAGENVFAISQGAPVGDQSQYFYLNQTAAAIPGQWYQFYAFVAAHRCTVDLIYFFIDDAGNWLKAGGPQQQTVLTGGKDTGNWSQIGIPAVQAPAGAHRLYIEIRKRDTAAGQADSWMWVWRPYVGPARAGQTAWNPYSAGSGKSVIESAQAAISANFTTLSNNEAALASSITSLTANYNGLSASVSSNASAITTLQAQAASLTTTVSAQGASISSNASAISYLNGQTAALLARVALVLDVNGYWVGYEIDNNGTTGAVKFRADLFEISSPGDGARTNYSGGNWRIYYPNGNIAVRMGVWSE